MNFLIFPTKVLHPIFARDILEQGPVGLGILGTAPWVRLDACTAPRQQDAAIDRQWMGLLPGLPNYVNDRDRVFGLH